MKTMLALAALAGALCVAPATAQTTSPDARTQIVSYSDLDLGSDKGRSTLDRRLRIAVSDACGTASDTDLVGKRKVRECRIATMERVTAERDRAVAASAQSSPTGLASRQ